MSRLNNRVKRLERKLASGSCPVCGGKGKWVSAIVHDDEPVPEQKGCERCGRAREIVITYVSKPLPHERNQEDAP